MRLRPRLARWLGAAALSSGLIGTTTAHAAPHNPPPVTRKKVKNANAKTQANAPWEEPGSAAPQAVGSGIFLIGDAAPAGAPVDAAGTRPSSGRSATTVKARSRPNAQSATNTRLVAFCRAYLGRKLGNGQCSELAALGLPAVGARLDWNQLWGAPVCDYGVRDGHHFVQLGAAGTHPKRRRQADVRAGDIVQYEDVRFERVWEGGSSVRAYPHHTSVIERVSGDGRTLQVLEQNVDGTQFVRRTTLFLPDLTQGTLHITRPIPN